MTQTLAQTVSRSLKWIGRAGRSPTRRFIAGKMPVPRARQLLCEALEERHLLSMWELLPPFDPATQDHVLATGAGVHGYEAKPQSAEVFQGKIYYNLTQRPYGYPGEPSKVCAFNPDTYDNADVLEVSGGSFFALKEMGGALYVSHSSGRLWRYDGSDLRELTGTPFGSTNAVFAMAPFRGNMYFATGSGQVYESSDGASFTLRTTIGGRIFDLAEWNGYLYGAGSREYAYSSPIFRTPDGVTWEATNFSNYYFDGFVATPDRLYATECVSAAGPSFAIRSTTDGVNWTQIFYTGSEGKSVWGRPTYFSQTGKAYFTIQSLSGVVRMVPVQSGAVDSRIVTQHAFASLVEVDGRLFGIGGQSTWQGSPYVISLLGNYEAATATLGGAVFDDVNNDGVHDPGETGIGGAMVQLFDQLAGVEIGATFTEPDGTFLFQNVPPGTYRLLETQPAEFLDGDETAGAFGGTVDNTQDWNEIRDIVYTGGGSEGSGYLFAEIRPSRIQGLVWEDFNDDGEVNFGERAIEGVQVRLTGTDDRGNPVDLLMATDAQGLFEFAGPLFPLRPGDYTLTETQPAAYVDGKDSLGTVNGVVTGDASVSDQFSGIILPHPGSDGVNYNFGERPAAGGQVSTGQTATIGFWQNKNGQALINALNGGPTSTQLAAWLAATFPNMYGVNAVANNLAGKTNAEVADLYTSLFKRNANTTPGGPPKLDAQVLAVALAAYATNADLAGTTAASYGFSVTEHGLAVSTFDVGDANRAAFGLSASESTVLSVMDILLATDSLAHDGLLYDQNGNEQIDSIEQAMRTMANDVYTAINEHGGI